MKILKQQPAMFASNQNGIVKRHNGSDNKFGYINSNNASGQLPVIQPVVDPQPEPTPPAETTPPANTGDSPCTPRPACLDANPPCQMAVPAGGWCKKDEPVSGVNPERQKMMIEGASYLIGTALGATAGYFIAKKRVKNVYGGILIGGGIVAGGVYLFFNGNELIDKFSRKGKTDTKSNASGKPDKKKCKSDCGSKYKPMSDYWYSQYYQMPVSNPPIPLANPKISLIALKKKMSSIAKAYDCCLLKCDNPKYNCSESISD
jgi:hypothetical protein